MLISAELIRIENSVTLMWYAVSDQGMCISLSGLGNKLPFTDW
jgi:hypothetical protein